MKIKLGEKLISCITYLIVLVFMASCGEDFTDKYNKLKDEYAEVSKQKEEILKKNEELSGKNLEMVKARQNTLVTDFITGLLNTLDVENSAVYKQHKSTYKNTYKEGKMTETVVYRTNTSFIPTESQANQPTTKEVFAHKYNEDNVLIESKSENKTITWGWENQNCVSFNIQEGDDETTYKLNTDGQFTSIKSENYVAEYTYNDNGQILTTDENYKSQNYHFKSTNEYNAEGKLTSSIVTLNDNPYRKYTLNYDNNKFTYKHVLHSLQGVLYNTTSAFYNEQGLLTEYHTKNERFKGGDIEIEYTNGVISHLISKTTSYNNDNEPTNGYKKEFTEITNKEVAHIVIPGFTDLMQPYHFKKCRFKQWDLDIKTNEYKLKDNYEIECFEEEDNTHNYKRKLYFDKDDNKTKEIINQTYFTDYPYAPKSRIVKLYENNAEASSNTEVNEKNEKYHYNQTWVAQ